MSMIFVPALVGVLLLGACAAVHTTSVDVPIVVPIRRLGSEPERGLSEFSGLLQAVDRVIRSNPEWRQLWAVLWKRTHPPPVLPPVDFSREMVVVTAAGEFAAGGTTVLVSSASKSRNRLTIETRRISFMGCLVPDIMTQPVDVAIVPRHDGPVTFVNRVETVWCEVGSPVRR